MSVSPDINPEPRFGRGDRVSLRGSGEIGVVMAVRPVEGEWQYELFMNAAENYVYAERFLMEVFYDDDIVGKLRRWSFIEPDAFRQALTTLKLRKPLEQNLYSYLASRTDLQPYQFKPILKLLASPYGRMFIADEVGLGKTIEAGIVMLELAARVNLRRVLVVCPPALRRKWRAELFERFDQEFDILDRSQLLSFLGSSEQAHAPMKAICSLGLLRAADILERFSETDGRFDLVIVDESHHMQNPETASHRLGEQLSAISDHMLMLSATPLSLSTDNLFHQLSILVPEEFFDVAEFRSRIEPNRHLNQAIRALRNRPPLVDAALAELEAIRHLQQGRLFVDNPFYQEVCEALRAGGALSDEDRFHLQQRINDLNTIGHVFTRTRKREVQDHFPARRAAVVKVTLTDQELEFYDAVTEYVRATSGGGANFVAVMPQRQVASSIPAAREYLRERWGAVAQVEDDTADDADLDVEAGAELPALADEAWTELARSWQAVEGIDSKFEAFAAAIREALENGTAKDGKVLVFSFFRKTIEHLERRLRTLEFKGRPVRVSRLYGPTPEEERHAIVRAFREEPGPHIVLASEIAAEGLDFEFVNVMVNYDLPWNPMRVEQRIGRLDRYGQAESTIHIINFSVEDTIEERILDRLYTRIGIFEAAIGDLESILGDEIQQLTRELLRPGLTAEEEAEIISQRAENIVRRRADDERFEQESKALLGQDDVFAEQLNQIERERRYVGPEEIENFVGVALRARYPRLKIGEAEDGLVRLTLPGDGELRELMSSYLQRHPERGGRKAWAAVANARPGGEWTVTFHPRTATRRRDIDFVTLQHPLVGALLETEEDVLRPVSSLLVRAAGIEPGAYLFFLYLLDVHSFRSGLEFVSVAVRADGAVDPEVSARLLALVRDADRETATVNPSDAQIDAAQATAESFLTRVTREREDELRKLSDLVVDRRAASLQESFDRWVEHRRSLLATAEWHGQQSIARLHRGYIRRREAELAKKLRELEDQRSVRIGHEVVAGGVIVVVAAA